MIASLRRWACLLARQTDVSHARHRPRHPNTWREGTAPSEAANQGRKCGGHDRGRAGRGDGKTAHIFAESQQCGSRS
ncbi:hypothetical protein BDZ89DRAFT_206030 [Hymenopellis radicata]|nr:hypothetical protein BDZ89DRAFT_206030 [Hymenopellis radicata]